MSTTAPRRTVPPQAAPRRPAPLRDVWLPTALIAVMVLAATLSLRDVFTTPPSDWLPPAAGPAVVGLAAAALARSLGGRLTGPLAAGLVAAAWWWCRLWWPDTLLLGVLPQQDTATAVADTAEALRATIWTETVPVETTLPVLAGLGATVALLALVADAIALGARSPAAAGLVPVALVALGAVITAGVTPWPALALAAGAWLALLALVPAGRGTAARPGTPDERPAALGGTAAALGTVAAGVVAVLALVASLATLPYLSSGLAPEGQRFVLGQGAGPVNPAADLGQELRRTSSDAGISYVTRDGRGVYLRTAVVDDVAASPWDATAPQYAGDPTTTGFSPAAERLAGTDGTGPDTAPDQVTVTLDGWSGNWAPLPDQVWALEDVVGAWGWQVDPSTSTAYREEATPAEVTYRTAVLPLDLDLEELAARAGDLAPQGVFNRWGAEPALEGSDLQALAREITAGTTNPVEQAVALQGYLLSDRFTYSETAPAERGYDGSGLQMTEQFLQAGAGYCIHFASAMVMMAQSVGIPARVVVGYAPVAPSDGVHRVTSDRAHAWPELYIDEVGWVPFEPTQGVGRLPAYAQPGSAGGPGPSADPTAGAAVPSAAGTAAAEPSPSDAGRGGRGAPGPWRMGPVAGPVLAAAVVLAAGALLLCVPRWVRAHRRRRRLDSGSVPAVWDELEDTATDLGLARQPHEPEQAFAARLSAGPEASAVAEAIVWSRYAAAGTPAPGGAAPAEHVADSAARAVQAITTSLEADAEPAVRRRARWFPRSLVPRWWR